MKKIVALFLTILLTVSCIGFAAAEDDITLDVIICQYGNNTTNWFTGTGINGKSFVQLFEEANPGIKLNLEVVSWNDVYTVVSTRISNGNAPDILNIDTFADYATEGLLLPVKDYCPEELYNDFFPAFIQQSVIDGTVWAVPDLASARAMYYNKDIFDEVGIQVPTTWAELQDACQSIKDFYNGDVYPWGMDMTTDEGQAAFSYYAWNNNGGFVDKDGNWALNSDANIDAVNFAVGLYQKGFTNPSPATQTRYDLQDMFGAGKMAMVITTNQLPTYLKEKGYSINYGTAALPHNDGAETGATGVMDRVMAFKDDSASDQAARNAAIGKFLTFFYSPEMYTGWVSMEGFLPAVSSAVSYLVKEDPSFETWLKVLDSCQFYPTAKAEWVDVKQGVIDVEQKALLGGDVKALLDDLQAKVTAK
ncbi:MAG TPA: extracellular solute-binding protein [Candidatus Limiplasma sp.]|nr:extracellular solute-binding protein [Candidatus Limiplasma sp.]HPR76998.1 extracellular solute-binding protein [Candidatus Limiplasma sp.]